MKMKKLLSGAMAAALSLSLAVPAFATNTVLNGVEGLAEGATVEVTGTTQTATVKVTVPTTGSVVLNPYGLDYTHEGQTVTDQIISADQYIVSESNLPIKVSTTVTGTIEGTGDFMATTAAGETDKKVNLNFEIGATSDGSTPSSSATSYPLAKTPVDCTDIVMDEADGANPAISFKFTGDAAKNPTNPWTTEDVVGASIAFTFALDNSANAGGGSTTVTATITEGAGKTSIATGETASLTVALSGGKTIDSVVWSANDSGANVSLGGSTNATETVSWVSAGGNVTITATVTYDTTETTSATFNLTTT